MSQKKLARSTNKVLGGVLGGIAEYLDVDATLVRICYTALTIFTTGFPGLILYLIMLLLLPAAPKKNAPEEAEAEVVK